MSDPKSIVLNMKHLSQLRCVEDGHLATRMSMTLLVTGFLLMAYSMTELVGMTSGPVSFWLTAPVSALTLLLGATFFLISVGSRMRTAECVGIYLPEANPSLQSIQRYRDAAAEVLGVDRSEVVATRTGNLDRWELSTTVAWPDDLGGMTDPRAQGLEDRLSIALNRVLAESGQ